MTIDYRGTVPVLRRAADLIEEHGWAAGQLQTDDGCLCVHGAISTAVGGVPLFIKAFPPESHRSALNGPPVAVAAILALHEYMGVDPYPYGYCPESRYGDAASDIAAWNDYEVTDGNTIVLALRNAASWAEGRASV
jgi:hypothetical protein